MNILLLEEKEPLPFNLWKSSLCQLLIIIHVSLNFLIGDCPVLFYSFINTFYLVWGQFYMKNDNPSPGITKAQAQGSTESFRWTSELLTGLIKTPSDTPWQSSSVRHAASFGLSASYSLTGPWPIRPWNATVSGSSAIRQIGEPPFTVDLREHVVSLHNLHPSFTQSHVSPPPSCGFPSFSEPTSERWARGKWWNHPLKSRLKRRTCRRLRAATRVALSQDDTICKHQM